MRQQAKMNFSNHMHRGRKHVASMWGEVVVGKGGMQVGKGVAVLSSSKVALKSHEFAAGLDGYAVVAMVYT